MEMGQSLPKGASCGLARTPKLLIADTEDYFSAALARASMARGMEVLLADDVGDAMEFVESAAPDYVVIDQQLPPGGALQVIRAIRGADRQIKCVVVTHSPSLACAVQAIKQGAWDYLAKPTTADMVLDCLSKDRDDAEVVNACAQPLSVNRLEWEHIQRVLALNNHNVSATARSLGMHRRTLQRKLAKYPSLR
jgi:two-component system response regulator RegA